MQNQINEIIKQLENEIELVKDLEGIKQIRAKFTTKSIFLNELKAKIQAAQPSEKAELGKLVNFYNSSVKKIIDDKEYKLENSFEIQEEENLILSNENVTLKSKQGTLHPFTKITKDVNNFFKKLGFTYLEGSEIESTFYNFDFLNVGKDHPARSKSDTFYLNNGKILRTHATNVTARELEKRRDSRTFTVGTVFRNDDDDATHSFQFNQIDILVNEKEMSVAKLKWLISEFIKSIFGEKTEVKFRPSFFPFTEPSFEVDMTCPRCMGKGCLTCSNNGMIEVLGSGMINEHVFKNAKVEPYKTNAIAAGIGLERIAMIKWMISDIRNFYINDLTFLKEIK